MIHARYLGACAMAALLAGCTGRPVYELGNAQPEGDAFTTQLAAEYNELAKYETVAMDDWTDGDRFAEKGLRAAEGETVPPDTLEDRELPRGALPELQQGRAQLVNALDGGARQSDPEQAAVAQTRFDCWVEQVEENAQPGDIAACREGFLAALQDISGAGQVAPAAGVAGDYQVFFDWDSAEITPAGQQVIDRIAENYQQAQPGRIAAVGFTDTSGPDDYNRELGERRAEAVREALVDAGVPPEQIRPASQGESGLLVQTPDGVREPSNRRTEIQFTD